MVLVFIGVIVITDRSNSGEKAYLVLVVLTVEKLRPQELEATSYHIHSKENERRNE